MQIKDAVEGFLSGYFSTCGRAEKTQTAYRIDLGQFEAHHGKDKPLQGIEAEPLERWARELREKGYAPASIRRKFAALKVFFGYWVRRGDLNQSPLWKVRLDLARETHLPRSLTVTDTKRLLEKAWSGLVLAPRLPDPADRGFIRLRNLTALEILFATGMRVGELVTLSLSDWRDDETSFVVKGKGARQRLAVLPDERSIDVVSTYLQHRSAMKLENSRLLVNTNGRPISTQGIARILAGVAKNSGIPGKVTPHMIRHTVATLLLRQGADIRVVQEVLGHSSIAMTQRYTHVSKEHLRATLQAHHPSNHLTIKRNARALRRANTGRAPSNT